jgi:hypothetical protein
MAAVGGSMDVGAVAGLSSAAGTFKVQGSGFRVHGVGFRVRVQDG